MAERIAKTAAAPGKPTTNLPKPPASESDAGYTVFARRYRPQRFEDFIGQEVIVEALKRAIETNRVAHAYLLTGARGVGKTSMARMFARALNCVKGPTISPCGECDSCQAIAAGQDVDVMEIDGASNNKVEEIRELRQAVAYRPSRSPYKIYIIDEVHMVTTAAFNALLKTLEEPPPHVKFIFATTEPQKIPITILSRCQRYDFSGVAADRLQERLREIIDAENLQADDDALEIVARRANGSVRDSQSLLDQVVAYVGPGKTIAAEETFKALGIASEERVRGLVAAVLAGDAKAALEWAERGASDGVQLGDWVEQSLDYMRDLMVLTVAPNASLVASSPRRRDELLAQVKGISTERLIELMDLLAGCRARMKTSPYARTLFEMTLVRMCRLDAFVGVDRALAGMAKPFPPEKTQAQSAAVRVPASPSVPSSPPIAAPAPPEKKTLVASPIEDEPLVAVKEPINVDASNWRVFWRGLLQELNSTEQVLAEMLQGSERVECPSPNQLTVFVPGSAYGACKTYAEHAKTQLDAATRRAAGRPVTLRFEIGAPASVQAPPADDPTRLRDEAAADSWVKAAGDLFGAKIISVDRIARPAKPAPAVVTLDEDDDE